MLQRIIDFSLKNKFIVLLATLGLVLGGIYAVRNIPLDAIPDLSDTQVIIYTEWPGQAPQIVQDQVTYPITTRMLSVPAPKSSAATPSTAFPSLTSSSRMALIPTGRGAGCSNT
jgi:Cu(I)/Ag(I) efflux system membrane protein CusA/SilA